MEERKKCKYFPQKPLDCGRARPYDVPMRFHHEKLRQLREAEFASTRLAVLALHDRLGVDVTEVSWRNWERGRNTPGGAVIPSLAALFDVPMEELFTNEEAA